VSTQRDVISLPWLLASIGFSLALVVGWNFLPQRRLDISPANRTLRMVHMQDSVDPNVATMRWLEQNPPHWECLDPGPAQNRLCGVVFLLTPNDDPTRGWDLTNFESIDLELDYTGDSRFVRLAVRNYDPRFSKPEDMNSPRIQSLQLRARDLKQPLNVSLAELTVPEWWIAQSDLPREYIRAGLDNVVTLSIDVPSTSGHTQEMRIRRLTLKGDWIRRETLYLALLCLWMLTAAGMAGRRLLLLNRRHRRQVHEIATLTRRTQQLRTEQELLRRQATVDELTGVLNRRGMEQALQDLAAEDGSVALILVDIDHFKHINDRFGHDVGDVVLRRVAAVLAAHVAPADVVARWGGEEFLVACSACTLEHATKLAHTLRAGIAASRFDECKGVVVTASFGVTVKLVGTSMEVAFRRADTSLYRAKAAGRNRVEQDSDCLADAAESVTKF